MAERIIFRLVRHVYIIVHHPICICAERGCNSIKSFSHSSSGMAPNYASRNDPALRLGLPKGSLNHPQRGNTYQLLADAGYNVRGYDPGAEDPERLAIEGMPIKLHLVRPQTAPIELALGMLDAAICGADWIWEINSPKVEKMGDLGYGKVRIVAAVPETAPYAGMDELFRKHTNPIICFTEYVSMTNRWLMQNPEYKRRFGDKIPTVINGGLTVPGNEEVTIIRSEGLTEAFPSKGAHIIVDNSQTGATLRLYRLRAIAELDPGPTCAGLYFGPNCTDKKLEKVEALWRELEAVKRAREYVLAKFNVARRDLRDVNRYLTTEEGLCFDAPTTSREEKGLYAVETLVRKEKWPEAERRLEKLGASAITTTEMKKLMPGPARKNGGKRHIGRQNKEEGSLF